MLGDHPEIFDCGEIFNEQNGASFFHFLASLVREQEEWAFPSRLRAAFRKYIDNICNLAQKWKPGARILIVDIKYDHFNIVHDAWQPIGAVPAIVAEIKNARWKVINLVRGDVAASVVSNLIAVTTGRYHVEGSATPAEQPDPVQIDVLEAARQCEILRGEVALVARFFEGYEAFLLLEYERAFAPDGGSFSSGLTETLADFLCVENTFDTTPKLARVLKGGWIEHVANGAELSALLGL